MIETKDSVEPLSGFRGKKSRTRLVEPEDQESRLQSELSTILADSIQRGLSHFGGPKVGNSILYILEVEHGVSLRNVGVNLDKLRSGINSMFGEPSDVIEEQIKMQLASQIGVVPNGKTLEDLIDLARDHIQRRLESKEVR